MHRLKHFLPVEIADALGRLGRSLLLAVPVGLMAGAASALFLVSLEWVTRVRFANPWLIWLLPAAGVACAWIYHTLGKTSDKGTNLILDEIHAPGGGVPARMAPFVLGGTLLTHLFGGSAGREGTAVQMGGSLAALWCRIVRPADPARRILLQCGIAAGFGSVFGTPVAGAIFALEVAAAGIFSFQAAVPVLAAALIGDWACTALGARHTAYAIASIDPSAHGPGLLLMGKALLIGAAAGIVAKGFSMASHGASRLFHKIAPRPWWRPALGALAVIALWQVLGTSDYLGLGVLAPDGAHGTVTLSSAFNDGGATAWSWFWKAAFTILTLASGFKGGEVTPLFFIGATLGNALAAPLGMPVDLAAGIGICAVFAGGANTPIACTLMALELFGADHAACFAIACFTAYLFSGRTGIYASQKLDAKAPPPAPAR